MHDPHFDGVGGLHPKLIPIAITEAESAKAFNKYDAAFSLLKSAVQKRPLSVDAEKVSAKGSKRVPG
jgi:hypothetical protein